MRIQDVRELIDTRVHEPGAIAAAAARRARPASPLGAHGKVMIVAADHPARGALRSGGRAMAMADRADLLDRLCAALARPGVTGVLATADILEDLLLLGALEGKTAVGSMNRGGLAGAAWEIDDRFTATTPPASSGCASTAGRCCSGWTTPTAAPPAPWRAAPAPPTSSTSAG